VGRAGSRWACGTLVDRGSWSLHLVEQSGCLFDGLRSGYLGCRGARRYVARYPAHSPDDSVSTYHDLARGASDKRVWQWCGVSQGTVSPCDRDRSVSQDSDCAVNDGGNQAQRAWMVWRGAGAGDCHFLYDAARQTPALGSSGRRTPSVKALRAAHRTRTMAWVRVPVDPPIMLISLEHLKGCGACPYHI
jgi:hypothetical protein